LDIEVPYGYQATGHSYSLKGNPFLSPITCSKTATYHHTGQLDKL
jgi:hypothetical protein